MVDWGYCAGLLRSYENYFLQYQTLLRWSESSEVDRFLKHIRDSVYGEKFSEENLSQYASVLDEDLFGFYKEIEPKIPDNRILKLARLGEDLKNVKLIIKAEIASATVQWDLLSDRGNWPSDEVYTWIEEKLLFKFPRPIANAVARVQGERGSDVDLQWVDFVLDSAFASYRFELLSEDSAYIPLIASERVFADLENIKNILRAKRMGIDKVVIEDLLLEGGHLSLDLLLRLFSESLEDLIDGIRKTRYGLEIDEGLTALQNGQGYSLLEKLMDEVFVREVQKFTYVSLGPEVLYRYLVLKKMEIKNLNILFIGVLNEISPEQIKGRIRNAGF